jgi:hypothetical protein
MSVPIDHGLHYSLFSTKSESFPKMIKSFVQIEGCTRPYKIFNNLMVNYSNEGFFFFQKIEAFEHRLFSHPLNKDPKLEEWYNQYEQKVKVGHILMSCGTIGDKISIVINLS